MPRARRPRPARRRHNRSSRPASRPVRSRRFRSCPVPSHAARTVRAAAVYQDCGPRLAYSTRHEPGQGIPRPFATLPEIRRAARARLAREAWNFGDGASESEATLRRNRRHLDRLAITQNVLVDVREIDLRTSLLGVPLSAPVGVAPMGGLVLFHPEGDVEMARGAGKADILQWLSGATGWPVEDVARAGGAPQMFQLYMHGDRGWAAELLKRVEMSGFKAVALTVDTQHYSRRERDILARWSPRKAMEIAPNPRGPIPDFQMRLTWADVEWLMKTTKLPVGLKGILTVADARRAAEMGVKLIWVSNHGGRQLDHTQSSIEALPPI